MAVTGASGFIGGWVVRRLLDAGYRVRACVRDVNDKDKCGFLEAMPGFASGVGPILSAHQRTGGPWQHLITQMLCGECQQSWAYRPWMPVDVRDDADCHLRLLESAEVENGERFIAWSTARVNVEDVCAGIDRLLPELRHGRALLVLLERQILLGRARKLQRLGHAFRILQHPSMRRPSRRMRSPVSSASWATYAAAPLIVTPRSRIHACCNLAADSGLSTRSASTEVGSHHGTARRP